MSDEHDSFCWAGLIIINPLGNVSVGTGKENVYGNCFLRFEKSGNKDLVIALSEWVFLEKGVLRVKSSSHHKSGDRETPQAYTIEDQVV